MNAWADGLNYYLAHASRGEAARDHAASSRGWRSRFSEGSIGGDIERVNLTAARGVLRQEPGDADAGRSRRVRIAARRADRIERHRDRAVEHRVEARAAADQSAHVVLLPLRSADGERRRPERLRRARPGDSSSSTRASTSAPAGCTRRAASTTSTSTSRPSTKKGDGYVYKLRRRGAAGDGEHDHRAVQDRDAAWRRRTFTVYRTHHGPIVREADGKWVSVRLMQEPLKALTQSYTRTKAKNYKAFREIDGAAHQLVEQHDLRRRRRQHRLLPRELHPEARHEVRLDEAGRRQRSGDGMERRARRSTRRPNLLNPAERLALQHQQLAVVGGRPEQPEAGGLSRVRRERRREPARHARHPRARRARRTSRSTR